MKRTILFVMPSMEGRGTQRSLISLLKHIPDSLYNVTVLLCEKNGNMLEDIPGWVNVEEIGLDFDTVQMVNHGGDIGTRNAVRTALKRGNICLALRMLFQKILKKDPTVNLCPVFDAMPDYQSEADLAVCYHMHNPFIVRYVAEKVKAGRKAAWIHNDFYASGYFRDALKLKRYLNRYDVFFGVSGEIVNEFREIFPEFSDSIHVFYNYVPSDEIIKKSEEFFPDEYREAKADGSCILLSVGSLAEQKGFDLAVEAAEKLKDRGCRFVWYIAGEGSERDKLEAMIRNRGLNDDIKLTGYKSNPYPYIKNCDIYVQTSRHEGFCTTVSEALLLGKPVVSTLYSGIKEQIVEGEDGYIVNFDSGELADILDKLIRDETLRSRLPAGNPIKQPDEDILRLLIGEMK